MIASITMLGAALAALAQDDLKRLLAWSTISQVAYMLAGVAVATPGRRGAAGVFHLLSHAAFKALLFLAAGCVTHLAGSTLLADMGGLLRSHRRLAVLFGIGLAALAGVPPLGGFWSKEAVLTAAERRGRRRRLLGGLAGPALRPGHLAGDRPLRGPGLVDGRPGRLAGAPPAEGDAETEEPHQTLGPGASDLADPAHRRCRRPR